MKKTLKALILYTHAHTGNLINNEKKIFRMDIGTNASNFGVKIKNKNNIVTFEKIKANTVGVGVPKGITDLYSHVRSNNSEMLDDPNAKSRHTDKIMLNNASKYNSIYPQMKKDGKSGRRGRRPLQMAEYNLGITLIALIITIIVLLILAGVTLNMVMGENGLFNKADLAKKQTDESQFNENIKIAALQYTIDLNADKEKAKENLENNLKLYGYQYAYSQDRSYMNVTSSMQNYAKISMNDGKIEFFENGNLLAITEKNVKLYLNDDDKKRYNLNSNIKTNIEQLTWQSDDEKIASVDNDGNVEAKSVGECYVTVSGIFEEKTYENSFKIVVANLVEGISLNKTNVTLIRSNNESKNILEDNLRANIMNENATNKIIIWKSSDPNIATVDENGHIKAISAGECTIEAKANDESGKSETCKVTVEERKYFYDYGQKFESITGGWTAYDLRYWYNIL